MTTRPGRPEAAQASPASQASDAAQAATRPAPPRGRRRAPLLRQVYGGLLRGLRLRQGRTLADVAAEAGVSVAYLSEVERGLKEPSSEVLDAVCWALGSSITGLIGAAHRELLDLTAEPGVAAVLDLTTRIEHTRTPQATSVAPSSVSGPAGAFVLAA